MRLRPLVAEDDLIEEHDALAALTAHCTMQTEMQQMPAAALGASNDLRRWRAQSQSQVKWAAHRWRAEGNVHWERVVGTVAGGLAVLGREVEASAEPPA